MAEEFSISSYASDTLKVVMVIVAILVAFGIGYYIVDKIATLSQNSNITSLFSDVQGYLGTVLTFLLISIVAGVGLGIVVYFWRKLSVLAGK